MNMSPIQIPHDGGKRVNVVGIPMVIRIHGRDTGGTPASFEGFFEEIAALSAQQQQDIPRVIEIGRKFGLELPPPPGA